MGKRMRLRRPGFDAVVLEKRLPYQVGRLPITDVQVRLTKVDRQQLRVHVRDMQQRGVAEGRGVVQRRRRLRIAQGRWQRRSGGRREREEPEEGAALQPTR